MSSVSPHPAPEPRGAAEAESDYAAHGEVRVLHEGDAHVEEDLLEAGHGELGLDLGGRGGDFVEGFENRGPRGDDVVAGDRLVPVSSVLQHELVRKGLRTMPDI